MQKCHIETDETGRELSKHGNNLFPIAGYDEHFSNFSLGEVPWHWHEEIELVVVLEGATKVIHLNESTELHAGEGIFINSNVFHRLIQISDIECHINSFVLKAEFLGGRYDSMIYSKYIKPIVANPDIPFIKFDSKLKYENRIIKNIKSAFNAYISAEYGYELLLQSQLVEAWRLVCLSLPGKVGVHLPIRESVTRISKIMQFIHTQYDKKLAVRDLAKIGGISESECYRLFQRTLHVTPNDYILHHRLQRAAQKLLESDDSILAISYEHGFSSPSYFTKKFKEQYACTPRAFRIKHQSMHSSVKLNA